MQRARKNLHPILRLAFYCAMALLPMSGAVACGHSEGTDFCGPEVIQKLYVAQSGAVYISVPSLMQHLPQGFTCTLISNEYVQLSPASSAFKQIYAALLSARLAGAPVTLVMDPTQSQCTVSYVVL